ncbi:MAG: transposase [Tissierellales bacterium]|jgi:transposase|nr:transposase [Tissierellales bacterium]
MTKKLYNQNFKNQLVKIYSQGNHSYRSLSDEYYVDAPTIRIWVIRYSNSTTFKVDDNRTKEEKELIELRKKIKQKENFIYAYKKTIIDIFSLNNRNCNYFSIIK